MMMPRYNIAQTFQIPLTYNKFAVEHVLLGNNLQVRLLNRHSSFVATRGGMTVSHRIHQNCA